MGGSSSPRSLYVSSVRFLNPIRSLFYFYFSRSSFLLVLSVGHQSSPIPIRVLQTDIPGRVVRETGRGTGQMAQRPRPDRRPHEALPRRRWSWYGIESGAARRLSSFVIHSVDHTFQKLSTGRRNDDACRVCWHKHTKHAKHSEAWNRFRLRG